ncbi:MAG TPA: S9 family peptidase [Gemmatimonas aurantiaca]|uniref:S9 family peptidase n=2 Tax=Gemmatimonas aurantiaca TaxID=173480 RepID=A0A3D4V5G9_9BACT|nr:S9 family peptidase [Gemmatimonas aurantiaca]BAH40596.1 putative dipeptidyl peptidase [Gemmatimonas aurantiaca T-27]HCT56379.1 S9 family peptidase [Gemmatimonas aurantiaca]
MLRRIVLLLAGALAVSGRVSAQPVTAADYARARSLADTYANAATGAAESFRWSTASQLIYRKSVPGGHQFVLVDASTPAAPVKRSAFDQQRLAAALNAADSTGEPRASALALPFTSAALADGGVRVVFNAWGSDWSCTLSDYRCAKAAVPSAARGGGGFGAGAQPVSREVRSPDGKRIAYIANYNVYVRPVGGATSAGVALSIDGSEGNPFTGQSLAWSPNSRHLAAYRVKPGYRRVVRYIESSPADQVQPKYMERVYTKPGDLLDLQQPALFDADARTQVNVNPLLFPDPYSLSQPQWRRDGRGYTFEYNERGHQRYRVIEVNAENGTPRVLIDEQSKTFIDYRRAAGTLADGGRVFRADVNDGNEIVWLSERDGWAHLYLYDGRSGAVKNQITKGEFVVRAVQRVDSVARTITFSAGGMDKAQDPYFAHYYRVNFDGTGLTPLTDAPADHAVTFSPDGALYVDSWSRVDMAPVAQLRRSSDGHVLLDLERGDLAALRATGWRAPEPFVSKGRDGTTDIYGVVVRPVRFDTRRKYPVIEYIYAGPHGSFVPKNFAPHYNMQSIADLGFIVVQIDGMGTANRSRAFHDIAWKNLGDAGFPDRIRWHKAFAAKNPWYDISRVGIFGGSAGGQNAMGALLFHPEFYKVAVSFAGCHDNRMDKIWWNEQWMGYPIGPEYAASSNVVNAHKLQGELLLVVPELDTNVDPASTMQVVNALIKADKSFDMLVMPGEDHGGGRRGPSAAYGDRKMWDFFVRHLLDQKPPTWNALADAPGATPKTAAPGDAAFGPSWDALEASWFRPQGTP